MQSARRVHDEKKRFIAEWIAAKGSRISRNGKRPVSAMNEAIEAIADDVFAPLRDWPRYVQRCAEASASPPCGIPGRRHY